MVGRLVAVALLVAAVFLVFGEVRTFGFIDYDDGDYVFRNRHLLEGGVFDRIRWSLTTFHASNWHPMTWLSLIADVGLFGLDPKLFHAEALVLHAANAALVFLAVVRLTGSAASGVLAAAVFAVHPLRAESVAWISERKGLLMTLFSLLAIQAHVSFARRPGPGRLLAVYAFAVCAMLSKPQAVALPVLLIVLDWWPLGRLGVRSPLDALSARVREVAPLLVAAGAVTLLTVAAQSHGGAVVPLDKLPVADRAMRALAAPMVYLGKTLLPVGLSPAYPYASPPPALVSAGAVLTLVATAGALLAHRSRPWLTAGWLGYLALLAPVTNLFQAGGQAVADRYTYLPHFPLLMAAMWAGGRALRQRPRARAAAAVSVLLLAGVLGVAARRQVSYWRDDLSLFTRAVTVTKGNWKMHYNLANTLERHGRDEEAEAQYRLALAARPDYPEALNNLGTLLGRRGEGRDAAELFLRAVDASPGHASAWFNLGFEREKSGDFDGALAAYGTAAALRPTAAAPRVRRGILLLRSGRTEEAIAACGDGLRLDPGSAAAAACLREALGRPAGSR